jgi:hypothetical protein
MDEQTNRPAPRHVIEALDASVRDIAAGRVHDALAAQAEAHRMVADHERAGSTPPSPRRDKTVRRTRSTS